MLTIDYIVKVIVGDETYFSSPDDATHAIISLDRIKINKIFRRAETLRRHKGWKWSDFEISNVSFGIIKGTEEFKECDGSFRVEGLHRNIETGSLCFEGTVCDLANPYIDVNVSNLYFIELEENLKILKMKYKQLLLLVDGKDLTFRSSVTLVNMLLKGKLPNKIRLIANNG